MMTAKNTHAAYAIFALLVGCGASALPNAEEAARDERRECTAALRFADAEHVMEHEDDVRTEVSLILICEEEPLARTSLGIAVGACFSNEPSEGVLLSARCWWGGAGALFEVRVAGEVLEAGRADIDEETGVGEMRVVGELRVPESAIVRAL
jgi:hypothetical protein